MEQLIARCAGIDLGQAGSVVCVRVPDAVTGAPAELIASYGTTTPDAMKERGLLPLQRRLPA
jgi:hypothetical protein